MQQTTSIQASRAAPRVVRFMLRQFRLPTLPRFVIEALLIGGLFMASVWMSGDVALSAALKPMIVVVLVMLLSMVASGVYRREIWGSIGNLYLHSAYGFVIAGTTSLLALANIAPALLQGDFVFLFLLLTFFGLNTVRPLLSGNEVTNGVGRRAR